MTKMEAKREQKRQAILEAARGVFGAEGYIGAGMDRIAELAGVTKQTVYRYFDSKEALFQASLEAQREGRANPYVDALDLENTREALQRFAEGFLEFHLSEEHLAGVRLLLSEGPTAPELTRAFFAVGPRRTESRLAEFLRERLGLEAPEYAVKIFLGALLAPRMHVLIGLIDPLTPEQRATHAQHLVDLFLKLKP